MVTKIHWIHRFDNAASLGIMARPRGDDWLDEEIVNRKKQKVGLLISLLEKNEIFELGLRQQEMLCKKYGIDYIHFPIADRDTPKTGDKVDWLINEIITKITAGHSAVVHCRMGIGRSSIIAGSVLLKAGLKADSIIENICKVRGLKVPDTDKQLNWLRARQ